MTRRLSELYPIGERVELQLAQPDAEQWTPGRVVAHDFPGIWVATDAGGRWFVTNHRRIRSAGPDQTAEGTAGANEL